MMVDSLAPEVTNNNCARGNKVSRTTAKETVLTIPELRGIRYKVQAPLFYTGVEMNVKLIYVKENTCVRPVIESGVLEELIDQFCDLLRRVLMAVVANAL